MGFSPEKLAVSPFGPFSSKKKGCFGAVRFKKEIYLSLYLKVGIHSQEDLAKSIWL
jgi:hypothetical protein